jgi:3-oxoacyl-[acyl-carrier protein] reductase
MSRSAFITGAARGIGKAIAERLEKDGIRLIRPSRSELDLSKPDSVDDFCRLNSIHPDILIYAAGENFPKPIEDTSIEGLQQTLQVNFLSAFRLMQATAPEMRRRKWGRIVMISSCYSFLARPGRVAYSASKAALEAMTRTAALEFGPEGILVNSVCPGFVDTELTRKNNTPERIQTLAAGTALGRLANPDEVAELVAFLVSDKNTYLTGQSLVIDGGFSIQ